MSLPKDEVMFYINRTVAQVQMLEDVITDLKGMDKDMGITPESMLVYLLSYRQALADSIVFHTESEQDS